MDQTTAAIITIVVFASNNAQHRRATESPPNRHRTAVVMRQAGTERDQAPSFVEDRCD
jgi:hypothetical protein